VRVGAGAERGAAASAAGNGRVAGGLAVLVQSWGEAAFGAFVRRSDDRRIERIVGSEAGLRVLFGGMARRFVPEKANGFEGEIEYALSTTAGDVKSWVVEVTGPPRPRASVRPGHAGDARLKLSVPLADFIRMAARDLDPGKALMTGRLVLEGDFAVAAGLSEMFGEPSSY
jgi:putative sterol carrier protein